MADDFTYGDPASGRLTDADVSSLASQAIAVLAHGRIASTHTPDRYEKALHDAVLSDVSDSRRKVVTRMRRDGISVEEIIDHYIPEVARTLGQEWADDVLSFAEVSLGSARLQEMVRALAARDLPTAPSGATAPRVLLILPLPEEHSLSVFVAADQFRRFGYDVDIAIDQRPRDIAERLRHQRYALIGITAAGRRSLASAKELVEKIRTTTTVVTPVVLGGSLTETEPELKRMTGVDHVVGDVRSALEKCGLDVAETDPPQGVLASDASRID